VDEQMELKRKFAEIIRGNSPDTAAEKIVAALMPFREEIEELSQARRDVGETLLRHGFAWRTGSEAEYVGKAISILKEEAAKVPTVVLTIEDGRAEIRATSGPVQVVHADMDREGETLTGDEIESILAGSLYNGSPQQVNKAVDEAREGLERYLPSDARPGM